MRNHYIIADHYADVDTDEWPSKNFSPSEIACKGYASIKVNLYALDRLQALRDAIGPLKINSAYRSKAHNTAIGGAKNSKHMEGIAFDISLFIPGREGKKYNTDMIVDLAKNIGFHGIGVYDTFIHVDTRKEVVQWGNRTT